MNTSKRNQDTSNRPTAGGLSVKDGLPLLLIGGGIGAVVALLFAPKSGREMRNDIADASKRGYDATKEKAGALKAQSSETLSSLKDKAGAAYGFAASRLGASPDTENGRQFGNSDDTSDADRAIADGKKIANIF